MPWYMWVLVAYLVIGAVLLVFGKRLNPTMKVTPWLVVVVLVGWFPMVCYNAWEAYAPKKRS